MTFAVFIKRSQNGIKNCRSIVAVVKHFVKTLDIPTQFHNAEISGNFLKLIGMKFRKVSTVDSQIIPLIKMAIFLLQEDSKSYGYIV